MAGMRRLAKRSIVGTRVTAQWQDGWFHPGVIQVQLSDSSFKSSSVFSVLFDEGFSHNYKAREIVGPGFHNVSHFHLKSGQKVFVTLQGREVGGTVLKHDYQQDAVLICANLPNGDEINIQKKLDEIRLLESRKSARLMDHYDTGYSRVANINTDLSKFSTHFSQVIDVPNATRCRHGDTSEEAMSDENDIEDRLDDDIMDETAAAMVLTNLSCSPTSPQFPFTERDEFFPNHSLDSHLSSSYTSSGFTSGHSDRSDPSPPHLSESAPHLNENGSLTQFMAAGSRFLDEGVEVDLPETFSVNQDPGKGGVKTMYKCTWRLCDKVYSTCAAVERHVRSTHLGVIDEENTLDGEEEFYYTEIEVNVDAVTQTLSNLIMTSPDQPTVRTSPQIPDHDYQKKVNQSPPRLTSSSVPSDPQAYISAHSSTSIPIDMPQMHRSLSWHSTPLTPTSPLQPVSPYPTSPTQRSPYRPTVSDRLHQHQAQSPKTHVFFSPLKSSALHKKPRGDVRKCRKVYGMENRDMWCTQCKWKKACSRFVE